MNNRVNECNFPYAPTNSEAVCYPDGYPSLGSEIDRDEQIHPSDDGKLRRFASIE